MACRVNNKKYAAIYDVVANLLQENPKVRSLEDVLEYFRNDPDLSQVVTEQEVINALNATNATMRKAKANDLRSRINTIEAMHSAVLRMDDIIEEMRAVDLTTPPKYDAAKVRKVRETIDAIRVYAQASTNVGVAAMTHVLNQTSLMGAAINRFYVDNKYSDGEGYNRAESEQGLKDLADSLQEIKTSMYLLTPQVQVRISNLKERIEMLESDDPDPVAMYAPDHSIVVDPLAGHPDMERLRLRREFVHAITQGTGPLGMVLRDISKKLTEARESGTRGPAEVSVEDARRIWKAVKGLVDMRKGFTSQAKVQQVKMEFENLLKEYPVLLEVDDTVGNAFERALNTIKEQKMIDKIKRLNQAFDKVRQDYEDKRNKLAETPNMEAAIQAEKESIRFTELNREIRDLEYKLAEDKAKFEKMLRKERNKVLDRHGYTLPIRLKKGGKIIADPVVMVRRAWRGTDEIYESARALKFMADFSVLGNQLNGYFLKDLATPINVTELWRATKEGANAREVMLRTFQGPIRAYRAIKDTAAMTALEQIKRAFNKDRRSMETYADKVIKRYQEDPLWAVMKAAGLNLAQPGKIGQSEEMWKGTVLDSAPLVGPVKKYSEDSMVLALNYYRMSLFRQFYNANPMATEREMKQYAEWLNFTTGTASGKANLAGTNPGNVMAVFFSAPKLLISKMLHGMRLAPAVTATEALAAGIAAIAANSIGPVGTMAYMAVRALSAEAVGRTAGAIIQNPARAQQARDMGSHIRSFYLLALTAMTAGAQFEDDPFDSKFLNLQVGKRYIDITGGIGGFYRMISKLYQLIAFGGVGKMINEKQGQQAAIGIFGRFFFESRPHPAISTLAGVGMGRDWMGEPYVKMFGDTMGLYDREYQSLEGLVRGAMPITLEAMVDVMLSGSTEYDPGDTAAELALSFFGFNTYSADTEDQTSTVRRYMNVLGEGADTPNAIYPTELSIGDNATYEDDRMLELVRGAYKDHWRNKFGDWMSGTVDFSTVMEYQDNWKGFQEYWVTDLADLHKEAQDEFLNTPEYLKYKPLLTEKQEDDE